MEKVSFEPDSVAPACTSLPTLMTAYLPSYTGAALMAAPLSAPR